MKKNIILGFLIVICSLILVGCGETKNQDEKDSIIGTWRYPYYKLYDDIDVDYIAYLEFKDDGSGTYSYKTPDIEKSKYFTYKIDGSKISIKFIDNVNLSEFAYYFAAHLDITDALTVSYDDFWIENNMLHFKRGGDPSFEIKLIKEK